MNMSDFSRYATSNILCLVLLDSSRAAYNNTWYNIYLQKYNTASTQIVLYLALLL